MMYPILKVNFALIFLFSLTAVGCAHDTIKVTFVTQYNNIAAQTEAQSANTYRIWYKYEGLNLESGLPSNADAVAVAPYSAAPPKDGETNFDWRAALSPGYPIPANGKVAIKAPLNKKNLKICVEYLKNGNDFSGTSGVYVVAYGCFVPNDSSEITSVVLRSYAVASKSVPLVIYKGKSCGEPTGGIPKPTTGLEADDCPTLF